VVGDGRYGTPRSLRFLREKKGFTRLALHSLSLQIRTPPQEEERVFRSPIIPQEILLLLEEDPSPREKI
jgi:23S rRNA-/tRNA-specific pseudouridylate synthase